MRRLLLAGLVTLALGLLAGCGIAADPSPRSISAATPRPGASISPAVLQTRAAIVAALGPAGLQLADAQRAFRPGESARVAAAPRAVYQVVLPEDIDGGYIVVYEFRDAAAAVDAGNDLAGYLGTGAGRVADPLDARHSIRQVGTTLIFYTWSPSTSPDPGSEKVAEALATLGIGFAPPR